jgi:hypothetical protein
MTCHGWGGKSSFRLLSLISIWIYTDLLWLFFLLGLKKKKQLMKTCVESCMWNLTIDKFFFDRRLERCFLLVFVIVTGLKLMMGFARKSLLSFCWYTTSQSRAACRRMDSTLF